MLSETLLVILEPFPFTVQCTPSFNFPETCCKAQLRAQRLGDPWGGSSAWRTGPGPTCLSTCFPPSSYMLTTFQNLPGSRRHRLLFAIFLLQTLFSLPKHPSNSRPPSLTPPRRPPLPWERSPTPFLPCISKLVLCNRVLHAQDLKQAPRTVVQRVGRLARLVWTGSADAGLLLCLRSVSDSLGTGWGRMSPPAFLALADFLLRQRG